MSKKIRNTQIDKSAVRSLLEVAIANDDETVPASLLVLSEMKHFLNASRISPDMPLPPHVMPFKFTRKMSKTDLEALGWGDLQLVSWLRWLLEGDKAHLKQDLDVEKSDSFAKAVLQVVSKQWDGLSQSSKTDVIQLISSRSVIPTKLGLKRPAESYFPSVNLFDDLAVVSPLHSVKERFLSALGVSNI